MSDTSDQRWVERIEGDARGLHAFLAMIAGDRALADDLYQETCLEAWRSRLRYREDGDFAAWLRGIARIVVRRHRRDVARRAVLPFSDEVLDRLEETWARRVVAHDPASRVAALAACVERLEVEQAHWLCLRYAEGRPIAEVAVVMGRSEAAGKMMLMRLRERLERCVRDAELARAEKEA